MVVCPEQLADVDDVMAEIFLSDHNPTEQDLVVCMYCGALSYLPSFTL